MASSNVHNNPYEDAWVEHSHGRIFARMWSPATGMGGAPIVLFHDSLGCVDLWRGFPASLSESTGRRVIAYDRLGFGRSDAHPGPLSLTFIRDEAAVAPRLCEALGLDVIIPFGHSVGGAMAVATAARWPGRCAAVVTMSAQSFVEDRTLSGVRAARADFEQPGQFERLERYHGEKARWVLNSWIETWLSPSFAGWCLDNDLRALQCPLLALHGDHDEYGSQEHPERITRLTQGMSRAVILHACGHLPHREQPARVLDEVRQFLSNL